MRIDPPSATRPRMIERFPLTGFSQSLALMITVLAVGAAYLVRVALDPVLPQGIPFLTFFPVIIAVAFLFGARLGVLATVLSGIVSWYYFLPPVHAFALTGRGAVALGFFAAVTGTQIALVHWMTSSNRALIVEREANARLAMTRELLFRELQHRVSNNLQMVGALLTLQKKRVTDAEARDALDEAARRLGIIGKISRQLYDPAGGGKGLAAFLDQLAGDVIDASGRSGVVHSVAAADDTTLGPDAAIPLALIVAESVANAIEHGFEGRERGTVAIRLNAMSADRLALEVEDDGIGLPSGFSLDDQRSIGLQIAAMLAEQLGGRFSLSPADGQGAVARLELPLTA